MMLLRLQAFFELFRYEFTHARRGFPGVYDSVRRVSTRGTAESPEIVSKICEAVALAACFYWKPVLCLQRSVVATRLLRRYGIEAELVIGYRPAPFFSHSWVEVRGTVVNDSPAFQQLLVLDRI